MANDSQRAVISCRVFGGKNKEGKLVGSRHRWPEGWGKGCCAFCGHTLDQVTKEVNY